MELIPLYKDMAAGGDQFRGLSLLQHREQISKMIRRHSAETLLDYGCGAGDAYRSPNKVHHEWGLKRKDVHLYDPAFAHNKEPSGLFDAVICSDVLEHIPEDSVDVFVTNLFAHARKFVWASVCCRPAKKCFPGTDVNLHVTVRPFAWWEAKFAGAAGNTPFVLVETP